MRKHGGRRRGWKKLHLGVDRSGVIVAGTLTDGNTDDAKTALDLIDEIEGDISSVTADAAYDTLAIYHAAAARRIEVVVPAFLKKVDKELAEQMVVLMTHLRNEALGRPILRCQCQRGEGQ